MVKLSNDLRNILWRSASRVHELRSLGVECGGLTWRDPLTNCIGPAGPDNKLGIRNEEM